MKNRLISILAVILVCINLFASYTVYGASKNDALSYEIGTTEELVLTDDSTYYEFYLEESGRVNVSIRLVTAERYSYAIYDDNGNRLYRDSYINHNDNLEWDLTSGKYYVEFFSTAGIITIGTDFISAEVNHDENNDKRLNAAPIELNEQINTILTADKDNEFFQLELDESGRVHVDLKLVTMERYSYSLYDDNGNRLYSDSYQNHNGSFDWDLTAGIYYLEFYNDLGAFKFTTDFTSANVNHNEDNDKKINAADISLNKVYNSIIAANKGEEYFCFELDTSEELFFNIELKTMERYSYSLYNDRGDRIYRDSYQDHDDSIKWDLSKGIYYLNIYNDTGSFSFSITDERDSGDTYYEDDIYNSDNDNNYEDEDEYDYEYEFDEDEENGSSKITFNASKWAMDELNKAYENNLIPQKMLYDDMTLPIWRDEFAAIAVKLYEHLSGEEAPHADADDTPFEDLGMSEYSDYIAAAYELGLVYGITEYRYGSHDSITREQLATMLSRVIKKVSFDDWSIQNEYYYRGEYYFVSRYRDTSYYDFLFADNTGISGYALDSVYFMAENNVVYGIDESHFAPQSNATVEQAILIALRCLNEYPGMDLDLFVSSDSNY